MNRVCVHKVSKKIIEMQSGGKIERLSEDAFNKEIEFAHPKTTYEQYLIDCTTLEDTRLNTLKQNALNAGHAEGDIDAKWVTDEEYVALKIEDPNEIAAQAEREAKSAEQVAKAQEIIDNLPSRSEIIGRLDVIEAAIASAATLSAVRAILSAMMVVIRRLCIVVYWLARGTE